MTNVVLFTGGISTLPVSGRPTGIYKQRANAPLDLGLTGFAGDRQADLRVHGGADKAVHLYPSTHFATLAARFPEAVGTLIAGSMGENIASADRDESQIRIGDIFQLGSAHLEVCQPRNPCWKIDERFNCTGMAAFIAEQGLCGWYFRVIQAGRVSPEDSLEQLHAAAGISLATALALWREHRPAPDDLEQLAAMPGIAAGWQRKIRERAAWLRLQFHVKPDTP
jgi:MOSC domain-containing protein YiiM